MKDLAETQFGYHDLVVVLVVHIVYGHPKEFIDMVLMPLLDIIGFFSFVFLLCIY